MARSRWQLCWRRPILFGKGAWAITLGLLFSGYGLLGTGRAETPRPLESSLAGIALGSTVAQLNAKYPTLYAHKMGMGETLHEACNQKSLEVFTFADEVWSKGFITYVSISRETDISVCRDEQGALPDLGLVPATPRGVSLGTTEQLVKAKYGAPTDRTILPDGRVRLTYFWGKAAGPPAVENLRLVVLLRDGKVSDLSLMADLPGVKKPQ